jgi:hypothetical protein
MAGEAVKATPAGTPTMTLLNSAAFRNMARTVLMFAPLLFLFVR